MMETQGAQNGGGLPRPNTTGGNLLLGLNLPQKSIMGAILVVALLAFELFNFDTTRYALSNLLGDVRFVGISWASILATAFCAIDFAGLARLFTPEQGRDEPQGGLVSDGCLAAGGDNERHHDLVGHFADAADPRFWQ
jgi:hypothetical protein